MTNPDMTTWNTIACTFDHGEHATKLVHVDLTERHGFADLPPVPPALAVEFDMHVYDWEKYQSCQGAYCPAHDAVSETIDTLGIWEPVETILTLDVFREPGWLIDYGAQIGWFSKLVEACGGQVMAIEADPDNVTLLLTNTAPAIVHVTHERASIPPAAEPRDIAEFARHVERSREYELPTRLVKIDVEGAEPAVVALLAPRLDRGEIDHLLVECSPTFHDGYPAMVRQIIDAGYAAFLLPDKQTPPDKFTGWRDLDRRFDGWPDPGGYVTSWHQENVWFTRKDLL